MFDALSYTSSRAISQTLVFINMTAVAAMITKYDATLTVLKNVPVIHSIAVSTKIYNMHELYQTTAKDKKCPYHKMFAN